MSNTKKLAAAIAEYNAASQVLTGIVMGSGHGWQGVTPEVTMRLDSAKSALSQILVDLGFRQPSSTTRELVARIGTVAAKLGTISISNWDGPHGYVAFTSAAENKRVAREKAHFRAWERAQ